MSAIEYDEEGEAFFSPDYLKDSSKKGKGLEKKKSYLGEMPPPFPKAALKSKKAKPKIEESDDEEVDDELESALKQVVRRIESTVIEKNAKAGESRSKEKLISNVHKKSLQGVKMKEPKAPKKPGETSDSDDEEDNTVYTQETLEAGELQLLVGDSTENETGGTSMLRRTLVKFLEQAKTLGRDRDTTKEEFDDKQFDRSLTDLGEFSRRQSGKSPLTNKQDDEAYLDLSDRIRAFYAKVDKEKLKKGVGHAVEWALKNGEEKFNKKLQMIYQVDLNTFENMEEDYANDWSSERKPSEDQQGSPLSAFQKDKLISLIKRNEKPENLEKRVYKALKYATKHGVDRLNEKLMERYGEDLEKQGEVSKVIVLNDHGRKMLQLFYSKYDPTFIDKGGLEQVEEWTNKNGVHALNRKLKKKYKESLMEFTEKENQLRSALESFYDMVGKSKEKDDLDEVVTWGLINGVSALNSQLLKKYNQDLRDVEGSPWTQEISTLVL